MGAAIKHPVSDNFCYPGTVTLSPERQSALHGVKNYKTKSQAVARIADRTATQQTLVISTDAYEIN